MYEMVLKLRVVKFGDKRIPKFHLIKLRRKWSEEANFSALNENRVIIRKLNKYKQLMS